MKLCNQFRTTAIAVSQSPPVRLNVLPGNIGKEPLIAVRFYVQDQRPLAPLSLPPKKLTPQKQAQFKGHIEPW